jgi:hypothetical protein
MGTWDAGPFDNDTAVDRCGDLDNAAPGQRSAMVRSALAAVLDNGDDYLDSDVAAEAIAAAALVASQLRGYASAPDFVLAGGRLELPDDVPDLAVQALDRIVGEDSEWRELWDESDDSASAFATVRQLRATIQATLNG